MILSLENTEESKQGFIIMPNRAMPWHHIVWIYSIFAAFMLGIAMGFFFQGFVLVLPFAGLELMALGVGLYISACRGKSREVITISDNKVKVEIGRDKPEQCYEFERCWSQIVLQKPGNRWYPSRLLIRSHGRHVEVGGFLNEEERIGLARALRNTI